MLSMYDKVPSLFRSEPNRRLLVENYNGGGFMTTKHSLNELLINSMLPSVTGESGRMD